jgi:hypothetical protein
LKEEEKINSRKKTYKQEEGEKAKEKRQKRTKKQIRVCATQPS